MYHQSGHAAILSASTLGCPLQTRIVPPMWSLKRGSTDSGESAQLATQLPSSNRRSQRCDRPLHSIFALRSHRKHGYMPLDHFPVCACYLGDVGARIPTLVFRRSHSAESPKQSERHVRAAMPYMRQRQETSRPNVGSHSRRGVGRGVEGGHE
jgi:hypothetical protein